MPRIFISYRRADSAGHAGRLYDHLVQRYHASAVFLDVISLQPGDDFQHTIDAALEQFDVTLVVIGPEWASITDDRERLRLHHPQDVVRGEVAAALRRAAQGKMRVFPVLVGGARLPRPVDLPPDLRPLLQLNAIEITHARFEYDLQTLVDAIGGAMGTVIVTEKPTPYGLYQQNQRLKLTGMTVTPIAGLHDTVTILIDGRARGKEGVARVEAGVHQISIHNAGMDASEPVSFRIRGGETVRFHYSVEWRRPALPNRLLLQRVDVP